MTSEWLLPDILKLEIIQSLITKMILKICVDGQLSHQALSFVHWWIFAQPERKPNLTVQMAVHYCSWKSTTEHCLVYQQIPRPMRSNLFSHNVTERNAFCSFLNAVYMLCIPKTKILISIILIHRLKLKPIQTRFLANGHWCSFLGQIKA